jgi:hypothetical protein
MANTLWIIVCKLACYVFLRWHIYRVKSNVYRSLFEKKLEWYPVAPHRDLEALAATLRKCIWTADGPKQLWDAISFPGAVQARIDSGDWHIGDCDEFAIYICAVILKSHIPGVADPKLLTVTWQEKDGTLGGHNVCLMRFPGAPAETAWGYMDYGMPRRFASPHDCVTGILHRYGGEICLGWSISDPETLRPLESHFY